MSARASLGGVQVGDGLPVVVMGALNVSPESFYCGSVFADLDDLLRAAGRMVEGGASVLDVGARASAPYRRTEISEAEEAWRLGRAVEVLAGKLGVPISVDTFRAGPARVALDAGATIINDVSGLTADRAMGGLVARAGAGLIVMASPRASAGSPGESPISAVLGLLEESLALAGGSGIAAERIVVDPGIGFFRGAGRPWFEWDCEVLARLGELLRLGRPLCVGVSRKSFLGALLGQDDPGERLVGSLAATAVAVLNGAHLVRTHDVVETRHAVRVAQAIRQFQG